MHSYPEARQQAQRLADNGDLAGAQSLLERVVDQGRPGLTTGDPELLTTMRQLAGLHARAGDHTGARRLLEEAYAAGRQRSGPIDPLMLLLAYDLAVVADELANRLVARKNFALVAEHGPAVLGETHPAVSHAREYVAEGAATSPEDAFPTTQLTPVPGPPTAPIPPYAQPVSGLPVSGTPISGTPVSASPMFGQPVSTPPFGQPVSTPPFGEPAGTGRAPSRTPWVIAAAAVVFAVIMLVVVLVRPGADPAGTPVAAGTTAPVPPATTGAGDTDSALGTLPSSPAAPASSAPAVTTTAPAAPPPTTAAPARPPVTGTSILSPGNGSGVARQFTVSFALSAADAAATGTRLALTVCVAEWCFLDGPIVIRDGKAEDYRVTLGAQEGEGIGKKWTVRVDRLSAADYDFLMKHKKDANDAGTWGKGVTTPIDRLNKTPVSSVVVTKTS